MKTVLSSVLLAVLALLCATPKCHAQDGDCYGDDCYFEDDEYGYGDFEIYYTQSLDYYAEGEVIGQSEIWTPYDDYGWGFYMGVSSIIWAPGSTELANGWQQDDLDAYLEVESWTPEDGLYTLYSDYFYCWDDWNWTEIDEWPTYDAVSLPTVTSSNIDQSPTWPAGSSDNLVDILGTGLSGLPPTVTGWCASQLSLSNFSSSDGELSFLIGVPPGLPTACTITIEIATLSAIIWYAYVLLEPPSPPTCLVNPAISFNGTTVNGAQSAITGQQINLTANYSLPDGVAIANKSWTVSGTTVGNYTASNDGETITSPDFTGPSTTFYWLTPGNSLDATFAATCDNGAQSVVSATFNVAGVTSPSMTPEPYDHLSVDNLSGCQEQPGGPYLVYGDISGSVPECGGTVTGTPGIKFTPAGTPPGSGSFVFVQLINSDSYGYASSSGTYSCSSPAGLDTQYPYGGVTNGVAADAPFMPLPVTYAQANRTFSATMYLMWQPGSSGSIPVPLAQATWQFSGSAAQSDGAWTASGSGSAGDVAPANGTYPPNWNGVSTATCHN